MLPVVQSEVFMAHLEKLSTEIARRADRASLPDLLVEAMAENEELAADILMFSSVMDDEARMAALMMAYATYQSLKAQAESELLS